MSDVLAVLLRGNVSFRVLFSVPPQRFRNSSFTPRFETVNALWILTLRQLWSEPRRRRGEVSSGQI